MRRHNIFTLGIILTSIYGINAMADWPTKPADDIWTNPERTTLANQRCSDCCKTDCWLPDGTYYDNVGTFTETCGCPSGTYDIGFSSCADPSTNGSDYGYWEFGGSTSNTTTYGLTAGGQWGVTFSYGKVKGIASCNSTSGTYGVATTTEFSNTANGRYCWCKMTSPAVSRWVFYDDLVNAVNCASSCAFICGINVQSNSDFQSGVFGSVESGDTPPTCDSNRTYSVVDGQCKLQKLSCPSSSYDIGFSSCISASTNGTAYGYWEFGGSTWDTTTYGLTAGGQWGVTFNDYGNVTGIASCNSTSGSYGVATTTEFSNTSNGRYCWCKMTSPSASRWVFYDGNTLADHCANNCALYCANLVRYSSAFRSSVFGSVE